VDISFKQGIASSPVGMSLSPLPIQQVGVSRGASNSSRKELPLVQNKEELKNVLSQAEEIVRIFDRNLKFKYVEEADLFQVEVIDTVKDQVVRKIPPDEVVNLVKHVQDLLGMMLDVKA
jgi:flagellar protein FlaG